MKLIILKENFRKGLNIIERIVGKNLTLPILNNVLITAEGNFLTLSATDLEIGVHYWSLVKIEKEGKITIPAKFLSNFISSLPEENIILETKNDTLFITCNNYKSQIKGLNPEEFPIIPKINTDNFLEINNINFCQGISQIINFTSLNQIRPELTGIYFYFQKNEIKLVATDSFRLAEKTLFLEKNDKKNESLLNEFSLTIPQKAAREIINTLGEKEGKLKIYFSPNQILFEFLMQETPHPQFQLISRLIDGEYPNYQEIIPKKYETQIILSKNDFLNQVKVASFFSRKTNEIKLKINSKKNEIEIFSQNTEIGENKSLLSGKISSKKEELEIVFNAKFIIEGLLNIKSPEVILELNGEEGPAVLKPVGDSTYLYVVMPIQGA